MAKQNIMRAIDNLRDTVVGKIPMPNMQVEQITLALLYKFMDDMDQSSIEMGGYATFFSENFEKYSWKKIMSNNIGSQTRFNLYTEALEKFYGHPSLPDTFREIFKNATVPYKNAETLTNFLKIVDTEFDYSDSEQLGDAYEYLLSILGSQGNLGQFRTPRHIIDFIVEVVNPQKDETILDPACGTAGFLISAYKHIIKENSGESSKDKMTFDEKKDILKNINGYDIEPSMVRIAEMNLFLHGANEPKIFEYDTLTMDDKWNDKYDCILANPPFMTPKGGIKPHKKFGIKANRSEVLFVDYIASHLSINGRAGVIVPDGVVFKTESAYKDVRKNLIENSLYAVVSLPSGVFNPYSPISTYIFYLDKKIAKEKEDILFIEMTNDGFSLGTQRKELNGNQIPDIVKIIENYKNNESFSNSIVFTVTKEKIISNNFDLALNRYKTMEYGNKVFKDPKDIYETIIKLENDINDSTRKIGEYINEN